MSLDDKTRGELQEIAGRYPQARSALLPMLHLVQSVEGSVTAEGIEVCADMLGLSQADVSGVATFYTMYKRRSMGEHHVGVCTNTLCAVMGGDVIFERLKDHLDVGNDETTEDGKVTLEHIECNAACDFAPVMTVNWEFFDNQTPGECRRARRRAARRRDRARPRAAPRSRAGARPSGCSPGSRTDSSTRARPRPDRRWSGSRSPARTTGPPRRSTPRRVAATTKAADRVSRGRRGGVRHVTRRDRDEGRGVAGRHQGRRVGLMTESTSTC